jgi:hypothetical protein
MGDKRFRGMKGWLVTWEWSGQHAKRDDTVAAIFDSRLGVERIREYVEFLYATENYTLREQMTWARDRKNNRYPAQFGTLNGVPWEGEIICGHNPYLRARLVDDLSVEVEAEGKEKATWKERPKPNTDWIHNNPK